MLIVRPFLHWPPYRHWQERNGGLVQNTSDKNALLLSLLEGLGGGGFHIVTLLEGHLPLLQSAL